MKKLPNLLQQLTQQKQELDTLRPLTPDQVGRIDQYFRLLLNYHSNSLEGNQLDYGETKMLVLHGMTAQGKPLRDHFEITGHNDALKWIGDITSGEQPLTEKFIRELHVMILKERHRKRIRTPEGEPGFVWVEVGQYKTKPNHVETSTGEPFYFASVEETPAKMQELVEWYNAEVDKVELHPLLIAAEFHYRFVRIHPFDDGNGRIARLLMSFVLLRFGYCHLVVKTKTKSDYLTALEAYDDERPEVFYAMLAQSLVESMEVMLKGARGEAMEEEEDWKKRLRVIQSSTDNEVARLPRSRELILTRYRDSFYPLYTEMIAAFKDFDQIYALSDHFTYCFKDSSEPTSIRLTDTIPDGGVPIIKLLDANSGHSAADRVLLGFRLHWKSLNHTFETTHQNGVAVLIDYSNEFYYELGHDLDQNSRVKKLYTQALSTEERKSFINSIGKLLVDKLEVQKGQL